MIELILILIGSFFNSEMDKVAFYSKDRTLFPNWDWWHKNYTPNLSWLIRVPLSMFSDGWHFCKFVFMITWIYAVCINLTDIWYLQIIYTFGIYGIRGLLHEFWIGR